MEEKKCVWCKKPFKNETPETHYCLVKKKVDEWEAKKKAQGEIKLGNGYKGYSNPDQLN